MKSASCFCQTIKIVSLNYLFFICTGTLFHITSTSTLLNHKDAVLSCENLGYPWGLPTYQTNQDQLHEFMKSNNVRSAWLGVQKKVLPFWTWVNNRKYVWTWVNNRKYVCCYKNNIFSFDLSSYHTICNYFAFFRNWDRI